jgi:hypothetical protein
MELFLTPLPVHGREYYDKLTNHGSLLKWYSSFADILAEKK